MCPPRATLYSLRRPGRPDGSLSVFQSFSSQSAGGHRITPACAGKKAKNLGNTKINKNMFQKLLGEARLPQLTQEFLTHFLFLYSCGFLEMFCFLWFHIVFYKVLDTESPKALRVLRICWCTAAQNHMFLDPPLRKHRILRCFNPPTP